MLAALSEALSTFCTKLRSANSDASVKLFSFVNSGFDPSEILI